MGLVFENERVIFKTGGDMSKTRVNGLLVQNDRDERNRTNYRCKKTHQHDLSVSII